MSAWSIHIGTPRPASLGPVSYTHLYADAKDADYEKNPKAYTITRRTVKQGDRLRLKMAPGGGFAVSLFPVAK